ncbi:hypothetical protein ETB97_009718 [Aspergillus alliaceus]|uniref:Uncharacterized protein n=1 Tax=Petromyces alliaceus TaxID=209559 RepID=A0A8H6E8P3_PETAA|nr:hypothetical protein ETB97_009718 [Aspergillus burnettii]
MSQALIWILNTFIVQGAGAWLYVAGIVQAIAQELHQYAVTARGLVSRHSHARTASRMQRKRQFKVQYRSSIPPPDRLLPVLLVR